MPVPLVYELMQPTKPACHQQPKTTLIRMCNKNASEATGCEREKKPRGSEKKPTSPESTLQINNVGF